jgi:tripartite motif-containing protein 71
MAGASINLTQSVRAAAWRTCVAVLCLLALALALGPRASPAATISQFGGYGKHAGQSEEPNGIAVDQETGDIYLLDTNNERVEKFTKEGVFSLAWGWGVADGKTQALQTCTTATHCFAGLDGTGAGELRFAEGLAVDNDPLSSSHHDVYAVDILNHRVLKYSPTGRLLLMFGGQVNQTAHEHGDTANEDICPVRPHDRCGEGTPGAASGQFDFQVEGNFIAVGPTGTVYVGGSNRVQEFSPDGAYQSQIALSPKLQAIGEIGGTIALAIDAYGDMYVIRDGISGVQKYSPQGELMQTLNEEAKLENNESPTPALTLDPYGHVFLDYHADANGQHLILEFSATGAELASFDSGMADGLHGLAYGNKTGKLYIVNTSSEGALVRVVTPPTLTSLVFSSFKILPWLLGE